MAEERSLTAKVAPVCAADTKPLIALADCCWASHVRSMTELPQACSPLIVALGDSLTAGYGMARRDGFACQLQNALQERHPAADVIDAGLSGDTTAGGLARLPRLLDRMPRLPDLCLVELGANDAIRAVDPEKTRANLDAILSMLSDRGVPALLCGMIAPPFLGGYAARFNAIFPELAARHAVAFYPFFLDGVVGDATLTLADGMHPNARAIAIVARRVLPYVEKALAACRNAYDSANLERA